MRIERTPYEDECAETLVSHDGVELCQGTVPVGQFAQRPLARKFVSAVLERTS
jgi:hypothetical protein